MGNGGCMIFVSCTLFRFAVVVFGEVVLATIQAAAVMMGIETTIGLPKHRNLCGCMLAAAILGVVLCHETLIFTSYPKPCQHSKRLGI
jgi:hypothetical protein